MSKWNALTIVRGASKDVIISVIKTWYFEDGEMAIEMEKDVIDKYSACTYTGRSPLRETKTTEMFNTNVSAL